jgi:hypothetical protein
MNLILRSFLFIALTGAASGCSVLIGNIKPVGEKSESYDVLRLEKESTDWIAIDSNSVKESDDEDAETLESSDIAYQSKASSSIISLNSSCRKSIESSQRTLRQFTDALLLGIQGIENREEREVTLSGAKALETTLQGNLGGRTSRLRAVVIRKGMCVYDLMLIARVDRFGQDLPTFERFVNSFQFQQ